MYDTLTKADQRDVDLAHEIAEAVMSRSLTGDPEDARDMILDGVTTLGMYGMEDEDLQDALNALEVRIRNGER